MCEPSASKSIPLGAGIDVARSYIALAFGLLILNCLRGGIGGGIVPYNVLDMNMRVRRFFLVIFITRRTLELRPATANFVKVKKAQLKNPKPRRGL